MITAAVHAVLIVSLSLSSSLAAGSAPTSLSHAPGVSPGPASGVWPLVPRPEVVKGFSPPSSPWGAGHRGVDLLGHVGQQVRAAEDGTITFAGMIAGRGVVVVDHGATRTTYEPVKASVHVGDRVSAGSPIGSLQLFGSHCFPRACLHWGLIEGDTYLDPLTLVGAAPVRLLPLHSPLPLARASVGEPATPWVNFARPGGALGRMPGAAGPW
jgi:murein DD-endopeptidase MepM/ murein hydrolase activator NlpD